MAHFWFHGRKYEMKSTAYREHDQDGGKQNLKFYSNNHTITLHACAKAKLIFTVSQWSKPE